LLFSLDSRTGNLRCLIPGSETTFFYGSTLAKPNPPEATIRFTSNEAGEANAMEWKPEHGASLLGKRIVLPEEEVSFTNGNVTLAGTLVLPQTKGQHPVVLFTHGSGPSSRKDLRVIAEFFALNGVAALVYDKRGVGASTGNWLKSSFGDLAGDALAGVELLKNRSDINSRQIGLFGMSQGGWIVGLAASRSTNVAFIISGSGPGITPEEQGAYVVEHQMRTRGFAEDDIKQALALYQWNSRCAVTGQGWDEYDAALKIAKGKPWYNEEINAYDRSDQQFWRLIWDHDPVPVLQKVHCPVLAIFGESDALVPAEKSAAIWKACLAKAGNKDVTIKIFPHADHGMTDTRTGVQDPEFFTLQRDWILKHVQPGR
jgi:dienelactone hydrolase